LSGSLYKAPGFAGGYLLAAYEERKMSEDSVYGKDTAFISYSRDDKELSNDFEFLKKKGVSIWYDKDMPGGVDWQKSISQHIVQSKLFIIFISEKSFDSPWIPDELGIAKNKKIDILPIFLVEPEKLKKYEYEMIYTTCINSKNGINRWENSAQKYKKKLIESIIKLSPTIVEDKLDLDSILLGMGHLATLNDIILDKTTTLSVHEIELRRKQWVREIRKQPKTSSYKLHNIFQITAVALEHLRNFELTAEKTNNKQPTNLISRPLDIGETYVAPMRLVAGLITRLDQNWPPFISAYRKLVGKKDSLSEIHYYIEFCWLAWGPSVTTPPGPSSEDFVVLQAAYGDEANSLPLIVQSTFLEEMRPLFQLEEYRSGIPVCLTNVLLVKPAVDQFFSSVRENPLFKDLFSDENQIALYLPYGNEGYTRAEVSLLIDSSSAFYSTAYTWLMLEQVDSEEVRSKKVYNRPKLMPGKVLPFFEHANLANKKGLKFLQQCLARKAIYHILECDNDSAYSSDGYYRFATALFPQETLEILRNEIRQLDETKQKILRDRLIIPDSLEDLRSPKEVVDFADKIENTIQDSLKDHVTSNT
jgi:hypothetical protein